MNPFPPVRKAVFPVAGLGTRFLPATKAVPKELLPVVDKPLMQYAVHEAIEAGIDTLIFVNNGNKKSIVDHFTPSPELEDLLERGGRTQLLEAVRDILPPDVTLKEAIQQKPLGLGHAVLCARELVGDEAFAVLLPDDVIRSEKQGALAQMMDVYRSTGGSVISVEEVDPAQTDRYGIAETVQDPTGFERIISVVEKPAPEVAPSTLGIVGRYILSGDIFPLLAGLGAGAGGEIQLTDGIAELMRDQAVFAYAFSGKRYDCGNRLGMLKANIDFALEEQDLRQELLTHLRSSAF